MKTARFLIGAGIAISSCIFGCDTSRRLAHIEASAGKTEEHLKELSENTNTELGDLNDSTDGFNRNLEGLHSEVSELRKRLAETQDELERVRLELEILTKTGSLAYGDLRKSQTATLRNEFWNAFLHVPSLEARVVNAAKFMASLEHRFWKPELEPSSVFDELLRSDLAEIFGNLASLGGDFARQAPFAFPQSPLQEQLFGFALALLEPGSAASGEEGLEKLFLSALELEAAVENGQTPTQTLRPFQRVLLENAAGVKNLLVLRANGLVAYFVAQTSQISRSFPWNWLEKNRLQWGAWVAGTSNKSLVELEKLTRTVQNALSLEVSLGTLRSDVFVPDLRQILGNCRISEGRSLQDANPARRQVLASLEGVIQELASRN